MKTSFFATLLLALLLLTSCGGSGSSENNNAEMVRQQDLGVLDRLEVVVMEMKAIKMEYMASSVGSSMSDYMSNSVRLSSEMEAKKSEMDDLLAQIQNIQDPEVNARYQEIVQLMSE